MARPIGHLFKLKKGQKKESEEERERQQQQQQQQQPDLTRRLENKTIGSCLFNYLTKLDNDKFRGLRKEEFLDQVQTDLRINSQTRQNIENEVREETRKIEEERQRNTGRAVKNMKKVRSYFN